MGFDDEPISPVRRDETVTKRKPKAMMSSAPSGLNWRWSCGKSMIIAIRAAMPASTNFIDRS